jgi:hypothetical protein
VSTSDARDLAIVGMLVLAPFALVVIVALFRGYNVTLKFWRDKHNDK